MTMDVPWGLVKDRLGGKPLKVVMTEGLDSDYLDGLVRDLSQIDAVVGIGGGVAIDTAKYLAWKRGCKAVFIPTIISVNAYATPGDCRKILRESELSRKRHSREDHHRLSRDPVRAQAPEYRRLW